LWGGEGLETKFSSKIEEGSGFLKRKGGGTALSKSAGARMEDRRTATIIETGRKKREDCSADQQKLKRDTTGGKEIEVVVHGKINGERKEKL